MARSIRGPAPLGLVLALTVVGALVVALDQLVVATALPTLQRDLGASLTSLEWTVNAFSLSLAALMIPAAELGDRLGRKRTYLLGLVVFALASAACALAPNIGVLIAARVVQGAGGAIIMPAALALLTAAAPPARRGAVMGIYAAFMGLAVAGGPLVGGAVTEGLAWQWIFWINVPVIALVLPFIATRLTEMKGVPRRPDVLGLLLVATSTFGIVWALVRSGPAGWGSGEVLTTLIGGVVLLAFFVAWELRTTHPMLPMRLFTVREFTAGNASALMLTASLMSTVFFLAQYLQVVGGYSPLETGVRFLPFTLPLFFVAPVAGRLQDRIGPRWLISVGLSLQGVGLLWLAVNADADRGYPASVGALFVAGLGATMAMPAQQSSVMTSVPPASMGKAAGTFSAIRQLGGALGIAILAAVFAAQGDDRSAQGFADGFAAAMVTAAGLAFVGAAVGLLAPSRRRAPTPPPRGAAVTEKVGVG
ncbi:EmrB/QacA subfamily drug resistance transporter [Asanoa ferruginea]|uniref:EmrB/QacA subfamily drug resistance transporter n=1 Tax=Asanoa ferruginea TaxID=53367 RepID=A0A3D9ZXT2_9ACTN|nr:DHA2 family efflux MFS transporter permease subunit [Asanoa ferruginea]REG01435.1 EmrB/QacA subfamily drug resistance transporter [Asanoa ferruginea]GIF47938.1 MFS transporter [Asanoa ferruginea]